MKALTLTQPWATLVAIGAKRIETRSWRTSYRGPLAIHAAKRFPKEAQRLVLDKWDFYNALNHPDAEHFKRAGVKLIPSAAGREVLGTLPLGAVIATCRLVECFKTESLCVGSGIGVLYDSGATITEQEYAFGDYSPGRWAWLLADITVLRKPIPAKGALSLWEWKQNA